jgi:hypothetical protein
VASFSNRCALSPAPVFLHQAPCEPDNGGAPPRGLSRLVCSPDIHSRSHRSWRAGQRGTSLRPIYPTDHLSIIDPENSCSGHVGPSGIGRLPTLIHSLGKLLTISMTSRLSDGERTRCARAQVATQKSGDLPNWKSNFANCSKARSNTQSRAESLITLCRATISDGYSSSHASRHRAITEPAIHGPWACRS